MLGGLMKQRKISFSSSLSLRTTLCSMFISDKSHLGRTTFYKNWDNLYSPYKLNDSKRTIKEQVFVLMLQTVSKRRSVFNRQHCAQRKVPVI